MLKPRFLFTFLFTILAGFLFAQSAQSDAFFVQGMELYKSGKYKEAIDVFEKCDRIDKQELDSLSSRRGYAEMWIANCYYKLGDEEKAKSISIYYKYPVDRRLTMQSDEFADMARKYADQGDYVTALDYTRRCAEIEKSVLGEKHPFYAGSLSNSGFCCFDLGDSIRAKKYFYKAIEIYSASIGKYTEVYADLLLQLTNLYLDFDFPKNVLDTVQQYLTEAYDISHDNFPNIEIGVLWNKAVLAERKNDLPEAIEFYESALNVCEKYKGLLSDEYFDYALAYHQILCSFSLYDKPLSIWLRIQDKVQKEQVSSVKQAKVNFILANIYDRLWEFENSMKCVLPAYEYYSKYRNTYKSEYLQTLILLGDVYGATGEEEKALTFYEEGIDFYKKHPQLSEDYVGVYIDLLSIICDLERNLGKYEKALLHIKLALNTIAQVYSENSFKYLSTYGHLYDMLRTAPPSIYQHEYNMVEEHYMVLCQNFYSTDWEKIFSDEKKRYEFINSGGDLSGVIWLVLKHMNIALDAFCCIKKEGTEYAQAYKVMTNYIKKLLETYQLLSELQYFPVERLEILGIVSRFYGITGLYEKAIYYQNMVYEKQKEKGLKNPFSMICINEYSVYMGDYKRYFNDYSQGVKMIQDEIISKFKWFTSVERAMFLSKYESNLYRPNTLAYITQHAPEYVQIAYNANLFRKGLLLNSEIEFQTLLQEKSDKATLKKYQEWRQLKIQLDRMKQNTPPAIKSSLEAKADSLEKVLLKTSQDFGDYTKGLTIHWKDVQARLGNNDVAIEFITSSVAVKSDSLVYSALILKKGMATPIMIDLFEQKQMESVSIDIYATPQLYDLVWKPLENELRGVSNIYFAPDGVLHNIAIEYLPASDGGYMFERYNMYRLSSTRQLVLDNPKTSGQDIVLYGGIEYDSDTTTMSMLAQAFPKQEYAYCSTFSNLRERGGFTSLEGTQKEVETIAALFADKGIRPRLYIDTLATEESLKNLSGTRLNILHIATHGFYEAEEEAEKNKMYRFLQLNDEPATMEDRSLMRSGLLFAGANHVFNSESVPDNTDDGVLTAKETSLLDFRGLDLVVLSACETGLGKITGEGVFGLQRGFKKAGARTLLMSLWKVDDKATQLLMCEFYKNLLSGKTKRAAFSEAQRYLRMYQDGKYNHPKYWAAFVMLDDIDK